MNSADLLTSAAVAEILGWSRATVNRKAAAGELPVVVEMPGHTGARLFDRSVIEALAAERNGAAERNEAAA